jgi:flagellar protein FliJ
MKKFNFRLERILQYKAQVEEQRKRELSDRSEELRKENQALLDLTREKEEYLSRYSACFQGRVDVNGLKVTRRFLDKLHRDLVLQARRVVESEKKMERAKAALLESMRDRKKYDKLKERMLKAHTKKSNLEEQKALDEFGAQATLRRTRREEKSSPIV